MNRFLSKQANAEYFGLNPSGKPTQLDPDSELAKIYQQEVQAKKQLGGVLDEYGPMQEKYQQREKAMGTVGMIGGALAGLAAPGLAAKNRHLNRAVQAGGDYLPMATTLGGSVGGAAIGNRLQSAHNDKGRKEFAETKLNPAIQGYAEARGNSKENFMREGYTGAMALKKREKEAFTEIRNEMQKIARAYR